MSSLSELTHRERIQRLRELITMLRNVAAREGHMLYVLDALEMIADDLERIHGQIEDGQK